jgi:hypothetical protein
MRSISLFVCIIFLLGPALAAQSSKQSVLKIDSTSIKLKNIQSDLDELVGLINQINVKGRKSTTDSLRVTFSDLEKIQEALKAEDTWLDKLMPSIIALLVVLISAGASIWATRRLISKDVTVASEQLRTQESLAAEQLKLGREQLDKTIQSSLDQVKSNNLMQARITWIQDFRNSISDYLALFVPLAYKLMPLSDLITNGNEGEARKQYDSLIQDIGEARKYSSKVKLFLTSKNGEHQELLEVLNELEEVVIKNIPSNDYRDRFQKLFDNLETNAKSVIKSTWEQTKKEV